MNTHLTNILIKLIDRLVEALLGIPGRLIQLLSRIFPQRFEPGIYLVDASFGVFGNLIRFGARVLPGHLGVLPGLLCVTRELVLHFVPELRRVRCEERVWLVEI